MHTRKVLGTAMLWAAVCSAIALLGLDRALAAGVEVDARSAHRAVWRVYGAGRAGGTAFAIGDHHFLTCAHVIKSLSDHGAKEVFIDQHGSEKSRRLRVNYSHVALTLGHDIALFTTKETVGHSFALARLDAIKGQIELRVMGYPRGLPLETIRQTAPIPFQDEAWYEIPVDSEVVGGGFSGGPFFDEDGKVAAMLSHAGGNMVSAVKAGVIRKFLDGDLPWTACGDSPSVAECIERAARQTRELAESGDRVAQYQLGRGDGHLDKAMLRRAAEGGFVLAQMSMGFRLKKSEQWAEAASWFRRSAEQGHPIGWYQLGLAYYKGRGVTRNRERAFELILRAAQSGHASGEHGVGLLYERGHGTARDVAKARQWMQRAADKGLEEAREKLKSLSAASKDRTLARAKVMRAAKRSNVRAGPGTSYAKIDILDVGEHVRILERTGNWFRLQSISGEPERFVYAPLLTETGRSRVAQ